MERPQPTTFPVEGAEIRKRRMELGLTQAECADRAGITREYLSQLETGARKHMRPPTHKRLRTALQQIQPDDQPLAPPEEHHGKDPHADEGTPRPHPD